ncbi:MAG TPA: helix-turn-helix domain-containing protein [Ktedonobacterales bacterium]|jgi:predicted ArsR family transcriptional regulator|nr:helix-turn-helix domain-containing protein [Ktedonobacterales bacterium]
MSSPWYQRFLSSTRGRLIALLRRDTRTVDELAQQLHLTDNAVRVHLATLERDGLVRQRGVRRSGGSGKPAYAYELTPEADQLFPKPYAAVLGQLLDALNDQIPPIEVEALLRESGRRLAEERPAAQGALRARLEAAVAALNQLGGLAELDERGAPPVIRGYSCPLAALVPNHPEVCRLAESFVSDVAGVPLHECCDHGPNPHCCFVPVAP